MRRLKHTEISNIPVGLKFKDEIIDLDVFVTVQTVHSSIDACTARQYCPKNGKGERTWKYSKIA